MKFQLSKEKIIPHVVVLGILLIVSIIYFYPALQGNSIVTHDLKMHKGMSKEVSDFRAMHGEEPLWTNSMFGGMPADQISVQYNSNLINYVYKIITFNLPRPVSMLWMIFLGFYILLMCLRIDPWIALVGSLVFGFSTFFLISLQAGHMSKVNAISFMAPTIGGFILLFRGQIIKGGILASLFFSLLIWCNHPQIAYYTIFIIGFIGTYYLSLYIFDKRWDNVIKVVSVSLAVILLGVLTSLSSLWGTYQYGKQTIRGESELTIKTPQEEQKTNDTIKNKKDGLSSDYILAWSYGTGETFTFIYPSLKGGGNNDPVLKNLETLFESEAENLTEKMSKDLESLSIDEYLAQGNIDLKTLPAKTERGYYGQQRLTNGPVFIGVIFCLLSLLAMIFSDGKYNWVLLGLTFLTVVLALLQVTLAVFICLIALVVLSILNKRLIWFLTTIMIVTIFLAWGKNYIEFSELFINYFPLYNKFRSVTMILVVAELIIPLIGVMYLYEVIKNRDKLKYKSNLLFIGAGVLALFSLVVLASPDSIFTIPSGLTQAGQSYKGYFENILSQNSAPQQLVMENEAYFSAYAKNMYEFRVSIIRNDAIKALLFIIAVTAAIFFFLKGKIKQPVFIAIMCVLVLFEMVPVGLKYLNNTKDDNGEFNYWTESESEMNPYSVAPADIAILENEIMQQPWLKDSIEDRIKVMNASRDIPMNKAEMDLAKMSILNQLTDFRVANFKGLTSETRTSYFYKSIGGYHGAKLMRIQQLFDFGSKIGFQKMFDMLNVKYIVEYDVQDPQTGEVNPMVYQENPSALGQAWIVDEVKLVENADEEMISIFEENDFDARKTAVVDKRYKDLIGNIESRSESASIELTQYMPNEMKYDFKSDKDQLVVFSEIYYAEGWHAFIDDKPVDHFRTDFILRGLKVPAGEHKIRFEYSRKSFDIGNPISLISSLAVILMALLFLYLSLFTNKFKKDEPDASTHLPL